MSQCIQQRGYSHLLTKSLTLKLKTYPRDVSLLVFRLAVCAIREVWKMFYFIQTQQVTQ